MAKKNETEKQCLYQFHWDCGRMGDLESLFAATPSDVKSLIGKEVYFGEVLGKHSDIHGTIEEGEITLLIEDSDVTATLVKAVGCRTISGHNPFDYLDE